MTVHQMTCLYLVWVTTYEWVVVDKSATEFKGWYGINDSV